MNEPKQRQLVRDMARQMEERFREFDGVKGVGPADTLSFFAKGLHRAAVNAQIGAELLHVHGSLHPESLADIRREAIDAANYAAFVVAYTRLLEQGTIEDAKCECGCDAPVVCYAGADNPDAEPTPVCLSCALDLLVEREDDESDESDSEEEVLP